MPVKKKKEPIKINDNTLLNYNEIIVKVPKQMKAVKRNGDEIIVNGLTDKGNIKKVNK